VIVAIAMGVLLAGIAGALVAVPLVATLNAVATYLAGEAASPESVPVGEPEPPGNRG
jgi:predicted PurR-regulated permease PerM